MNENQQNELLPLAGQVLAAQGWDGKMRELMLAGKHLPMLEETQRVATHEVQGCESDVWVALCNGPSKRNFRGYSGSKIIRGILSVLLEKANHLPLRQVADADFAAYLQQIGLERYLSQSRGNGIKAVISRIQLLASS